LKEKKLVNIKTFMKILKDEVNTATEILNYI